MTNKIKQRLSTAPTSLLCAIITGALLLLSCSQNHAGNGSGSGVGNPMVAGVVIREDRSYAQGATVRIRPRTYLASIDSTAQSGRLLDVNTQSDGSYALSGLLSGEYTLEIVDGDSVGILKQFAILSTDTAINFAVDTLRQLATITGTVLLGALPSQAVDILIEGLDRQMQPGADGRFALKVPEGRHRLVMADNQRDVLIHNDTVTVQRGEQSRAIQAVADSSTIACSDGRCDSLVVRRLLDEAGLSGIAVDSVAQFEEGRIYKVSLDSLNLQSLGTHIGRLQTLKELSATNNTLTSLPQTLCALTRLSEINFSRNSFTQLPAAVLCLTQLEEVSFADNQLAALPTQVQNLTSLTEANFASNRLCSVPTDIASWLTARAPTWASSQRCP